MGFPAAGFAVLPGFGLADLPGSGLAALDGSGVALLPGSGFVEHFYTIVITDGRVSAIDFDSPDSMDAVVGGHPPRETISLVYNNMVQTHVVSSVEHEDSFRDRV